MTINADWRFMLGEPDARTVTNDDSSWELVSVPHTLELTDLKLNGCQDTKLGDIYAQCGVVS